MYNQVLPESQNLPVANHYRKSTDVIFTVFHATLSLTLFIVAVVNFSPCNFWLIQLPPSRSTLTLAKPIKSSPSLTSQDSGLLSGSQL